MARAEKEALYYEVIDESRLHCLLCPQDCRIPPGKRGVCRVRLNEGMKLWATNYARCTSKAVDPTEKKPLYHYYPGSYLLSLGTQGCNLKCGFCQNWEISQVDAPYVFLAPDEAVRHAEKARKGNPRCIGIAYTYSEPLMWFEYVLDTAKKAREKGLKNVLVTNGYINPAPLEEILEFVDAANVDLKAFSDEFYRDLCKGRLEPVLETVERAFKRGCHLEITTLIVPGYNDDPEEIRSLSHWIAKLSPDIPLHLSRYFPNYRMAEPPTPEKTLENAWRVAREHLSYVYIGNLSSPEHSLTRCPQCGHVVIGRSGMALNRWDLSEGNGCPRCGRTIAVTGHVIG